MTTTQTTDIEAGAQATSQPVAGNQPGKKGDYTKYFYRNINNLWAAVEQLQKEMSDIEERRLKAKQTLVEVL
jgi:hypothetical protein